MSRRRLVVLAAAGLLATGPLACSDDNPTGPQFGDLAFTPSFENLGTGRTVELALTNSGSVELGPILVGVDAVFEVTDPDDLCSSIDVLVAPSSIASLAPGGNAVIDVTIDTSDVDPVDCPAAQYDADLFAAAGGQVLGGATIRFDWQP